jgi:hypothetical protein
VSARLVQVVAELDHALDDHEAEGRPLVADAERVLGSRDRFRPLSADTPVLETSASSTSNHTGAL